MSSISIFVNMLAVQKSIQIFTQSKTSLLPSIIVHAWISLSFLLAKSLLIIFQSSSRGKDGRFFIVYEESTYRVSPCKWTNNDFIFS